MNTRTAPQGSKHRAGAKSTGAASAEASTESRMTTKIWKGYKSGFLDIPDLRLTMALF